VRLHSALFVEPRILARAVSAASASSSSLGRSPDRLVGASPDADHGTGRLQRHAGRAIIEGPFQVRQGGPGLAADLAQGLRRLEADAGVGILELL
jgi:hypothetical protein